VEGDADAYGELVARHRPSALRVATVVLGSATGADDVVQVASERAWRAMATFDPDRGFRPWFLRVVANAARNDRRALGRRRAAELRVAVTPWDTTTPDPSVATVTQSERAAVVAAMNRLDGDTRLVIALRYFEQLSEHEMGDVLGCPVGTVKSRLSRAMGRLRVELVNEAVFDG
jgi:RNA polymerase sigma-70 factor (ECF subfamily)